MFQISIKNKTLTNADTLVWPGQSADAVESAQSRGCLRVDELVMAGGDFHWAAKRNPIADAGGEICRCKRGEGQAGDVSETELKRTVRQPDGMGQEDRGG